MVGPTGQVLISDPDLGPFLSWSLPSPEISEAMKGQEVGIVGRVGAPFSIIKGCPTNGNDVVPFKEPIHILESVLEMIWVLQQSSSDLPCSKVV